MSDILKYRAVPLLTAVLCAVLFISVPVCAVAAETKQYKVNYLGALNPGPTGQPFNSIKDIFINAEAKEIFVLDAGNKRVLIFDYTWTPLFKFSIVGTGGIVNLNSIVSSRDGYIYVGAEEGVLMYSYRGKFLRQFDTAPLGKGAVVQSLSLEPDGVTLAVGYNVRVDEANIRLGIGLYDVDGNLKDIKTVAGDKYANMFDLTRLGDKYYFISPGNIQVVTMGLDAKPISSFGMYSSLLGGFSQPISIDVTRESIYVTDLNRAMVIIFDHAGTPKTEFGGPGVFGRPSKVALDDEGRVYVVDGADVRVFEIKTEASMPASGAPKGK